MYILSQDCTIKYPETKSRTEKNGLVITLYYLIQCKCYVNNCPTVSMNKRVQLRKEKLYKIKTISKKKKIII